MLKAWAQLVRLPNVFTAPVDVIAGAALSLYVPHREGGLPDNIVLLCLISVCYYMAGMILNDVADMEEDGKDRPFRPLPSRRISRRTASVAGFLLLAAGLVIGLLQLPAGANWRQSFPLYSLPVLILLYNFWLKHTWLGPITMGLCRGFNLLLGTIMVADLHGVCYVAASVNTLYVTGVTVIAHDETLLGKKWKIGFGLMLMFLSLGLLLIEHGFFFFKGRPAYVDHACILALLIMLILPVIWTRAMLDPQPATVGPAIKYSILGLIVIDAIHAMFPIGYPGLLVLLFLIPALYLGKYIYST